MSVLGGRQGAALLHDHKRAISRRAFLRVAGLTAAGVALGACVPKPAGRGPHGSDTSELVYQDWRTDWFSGMAQQMLAKFSADHPNIHVFFTQDPEDFDVKMTADFVEGTAPDVLQGCCDFLPAWGQKGYLLDLRPYVAADLDRGTIEDWDAAQYKAFFTQRGAQFALPKYHGALALYYNKNLFDESGVDYPDASWNHDDYLRAMKRLTKDRSGARYQWGSMIDISWERLQVHVNDWGGHFVDPQNPKRSLMSQPEAMQALGWIRDRIWSDRVMAGPLDVQNLETRQAFIQQRIAMVEDGSWALKDILEGAKFRMGVAPMPAGPARRTTLATTDGFAIYAGTKYPEAAWELLKFLTGRDYAEAMARAQLLQPARASLIDAWTGFVQQEYPEQTKEMDLGAFAAGHIQGYSVTAEVFADQASAGRLVKPTWEQIYTLGRTPVSAMREVSDQIEQAQAAAP